MKNEIKLNKEQFKLFNDGDQFQLFCDDEGMPDYENFNDEVDKLFSKYEFVLLTKDDYIYGVKEGKKEELSNQATEAYYIAAEVLEDY